MNNYKNLFEQIKRFKKEQEKQKQRGLNNYNILTTVLKQHDEVRLHSRMIASFLDPFGEHYQSNLFLDKFLEVLNIANFNIDSENCSVKLEYFTDKKKGIIDLYITDGSKHIIIENKVCAEDQERQIERYIKIIKDENQNLKYNDILVIYLSLDRDKPSQYSLGDLSLENSILKIDTKNIALFKSIHYKNEILNWLEKCKYEVQNITNLNEVFRQYIDVVKMINNEYKDKIMNLSEYIVKNREIYKLAMEIEKEIPEIRKKSVSNFFKKIVSSLERELGDEWEIELYEKELGKVNSIPLEIYKKSWVEYKKGFLLFAIGFEKKNYYDCYMGIVKSYECNIDINDIVEDFSEDLNKLNYKLETEEPWLHWEWSHDIDEVSDFVEYIQFNENAEKEFLDKIINLIKIFGLDSNLITEINNYLNEKDKN
jgi:hypothetical protein